MAHPPINLLHANPNTASGKPTVKFDNLSIAQVREIIDIVGQAVVRNVINGSDLVTDAQMIEAVKRDVASSIVWRT